MFSSDLPGWMGGLLLAVSVFIAIVRLRVSRADADRLIEPLGTDKPAYAPVKQQQQQQEHTQIDMLSSKSASLLLGSLHPGSGYTAHPGSSSS